MPYFFAPLEGLTNHVYRTAHAAYFSPADAYFTPFLSPNQNHKFTSREKNDVLPENNSGLRVIPQLLTNNAAHFLLAADQLAALGYEEVNLNLGCPSGTVVAKKKGSGFLSVPEQLDAFLDEVFAHAPLKISLKTRLGRHETAEFPALLDIFNRYPIHQLTIHPRIQAEFYRGTPHLDLFSYAVQHSRAPLCYNGDLFSVQNVQDFTARFPQIDTLMCGRGALANPALFGALRGEKSPEKTQFRAFHEELYGRYRENLSGDKPVLHKMKELWLYMGCLFEGFDTCTKPLRKAQHLTDYESAVAKVFALPMQENPAYSPPK